MRNTKSVKLSNKVRTEILDKAMHSIFEKRIKETLLKLTTLADLIHDHHYGNDLQNLNGVPTSNDWFTNLQNSVVLVVNKSRTCFHDKNAKYISYGISSKTELNTKKAFSICNIKFSKPRAFPPRADDALTVPKKFTARVLKIQDTCIKLIQEETELSAELFGFLAACKTTADVRNNWPDADLFLPVLEPIKNLPIPLIDNVLAAQKKISKSRKSS